MKKKYVILFSFTLVFIVALNIISNNIVSNRVDVNLISVSPKNIENTVNCSGVIKSNEQCNVYVKANAVVESVFVNIGDIVNMGDAIVKVKYNNLGNGQGVDSLEKNLPSMSYTDIQEVYSKILSQSTEQNLNNLSNSSVETEDKSIISNVLAPISGVVEEVNISNNDTIDTSIPIVVISSKNGTKVALSINESQIGDVKLGQNATVTGIGFKNSQYTGKVTEISDIATKSVSTTGQETVVDVMVTLDDDEYPDIKSGFTAKCKITTSNENDLMIIPYESVCLENDGREYVYKYESGKTQKTYVNTGREFPEGIEILEGINFNDVIIQNSENIKDNQIVNVSNYYGGDSDV